MSREDPLCPDCGRQLLYRDKRYRVWKWYGGVTRRIKIRRLRCPHCEHHHVELPDVLCPEKHYGSEVIENVVDDVSTPDDASTEDYPCEKTMARWKEWIAANQSQIDGHLKSAGTRLLDMPLSLLASTESLLTKLRDTGAGWLSVVTRVIYNSGGSFLTAWPAGGYAPALSVCPVPP